MSFQEFLSFAESLGNVLYFIAFFFAASEATIGISMLTPGSLIVSFIGALSAIGYVNIYIVLFLAFVGAVIGDSIGYFLGKKFGRKFIKKIPAISEDSISQAENFIKKHGAKSVFLGRFTPFLKETIPFVAGMFNMEYKKFLIFNILGAAGWAALWPGSGYVFAKAIIEGKDGLGMIHTTIAILVFAYLGYLIWDEFFKHRIDIIIMTKKFSKFISSFIFIYSLFILFSVFVYKKNELINSFDEKTWNIIFDNFNTSVFNFLKIITHTGEWYFILVAVLLLSFYLIIKKLNHLALFSLFVYGFAILNTFIIKYIFERPRPAYMLVYENGFSFPSGHATTAITFALIIIYVTSKLPINTKVKYFIYSISVAWATIISFSRIYIGVHYMSDIVGALLVSVASFVLGYSLINYINDNKNKKYEKNKNIS